MASVGIGTPNNLAIVATLASILVQKVFDCNIGFFIMIVPFFGNLGLKNPLYNINLNSHLGGRCK